MNHIHKLHIILILHARTVANTNIILCNDNDDDISIVVSMDMITRLILSGPSTSIGRTLVRRYNNIISLSIMYRYRYMARATGSAPDTVKICIVIVIKL